MGDDIRLKSKAGEIGAYLATPKGTPMGGVVVIQEIFGVNHHIRAVCDRLAGEGYTAVAPALFDRQEKNFESGYTPDEIANAREATRIAERGYEHLIEVARPGMSEDELAFVYEKNLKVLPTSISMDSLVNTMAGFTRALHGAIEGIFSPVAGIAGGLAARSGLAEVGFIDEVGHHFVLDLFPARQGERK